MQRNTIMNNIYQAKGKSLEDQYFDIGALFDQSIRKSVASIARRHGKQSQIRRLVAENTLVNLRTKDYTKEFLSCITAWANGASITVEQAMWLMADNLSGCQTAMVRYGSGIGIVHTEEEFIDAKHIELHMTDPHMVAFCDQGKICKTLVYNDLMPGAGLFSWKDNMIVAVDSLFLKEDGIENVDCPVLANVVSWMIWRMSATEAIPSQIVSLANKMGEMIDGYAINIIRKVGTRIDGYKISFVRSENHIEYIGESAGSYMRQTNIVDPNYPKMSGVMQPRNIWRGGWKYFNDRLRTIDQHIGIYHKYLMSSLNPGDFESVHNKIQRTIFTDLRESYINPDLGAVCVGLIDQAGTSVSCKLNDKLAFEDLKYIDLLK